MRGLIKYYKVYSQSFFLVFPFPKHDLPLSNLLLKKRPISSCSIKRENITHQEKNITTGRKLDYTTLGKSFEIATLRYLHHLGFHLRRTGGACDGGIDLRGIWNSPILSGSDKTIKPSTTSSTSSAAASLSMSVTDPLNVPVLVQCKRSKHKVKPHVVREFLSVVAKENGSVGLLSCTQGLTKNALSYVMKATVPIGVLVLSEETSSENLTPTPMDFVESVGTIGTSSSSINLSPQYRLSQFITNYALQERLKGFQLGISYERTSNGLEAYPVIMLNGQVLDGMTNCPL